MSGTQTLKRASERLKRADGDGNGTPIGTDPAEKASTAGRHKAAQGANAHTKRSRHGAGHARTGAAGSARLVTGLTAGQRAALGPGAPPQIWHPSYAAQHERAPRGTAEDEDEEQSYEEFVDMGRRKPNTDGTGRFKLTQHRRAICVLPIPAAHHSAAQRAELRRHAAALACLIGAFTTLPTAVSNVVLQLRRACGGSDGDGPVIEDAAQNCAFPLGTSAQAMPPGRAAMAAAPIDVFDVFNVLVEYAEKDHYALVAVMDAEVGEDDGEGGWLGPHMGRACGDRVAVVSMAACGSGNTGRDNGEKGADTLELCVTALHELMHTFGLDHCTEWRCLMNSVAGQVPWPFLAPHNLRKLQLVVGGDRPEAETAKAWVVDRYRELERVWMKVFSVCGRSALIAHHLEWLCTKREAVEACTRLLTAAVTIV